MSKIIFGGAFDPIHLGHINMAKKAAEAFDADVIFVPAKIAVWKNESVNPTDKINMIKLSICDYPRFSIDEYEIKSKESFNYTYDTIHHFLDKYHNEKLFLLIGSDQVNEFHRWKNADELSKLVQIIFFNRPNHEAKRENIEKFHMEEIPGDMIDVSSIEIRNLCNLKLNFNVIKYIEEKELYYIPKIKGMLEENRYKHSLSVAHLAYEIAETTKVVDPYKAYLAGLLHDIGKNINPEKAMEIMKKYYSKYIAFGKWSYHQFIGEFIAKNEFNIQDSSILNSIKFHATGNDDMDELGKIIYSSDKIEPTRGFDSSDLINSMKENVDSGFKTVLKANKDYLESKKSDINNELTYKCFNKYL